MNLVFVVVGSQAQLGLLRYVIYLGGAFTMYVAWFVGSITTDDKNAAKIEEQRLAALRAVKRVVHVNGKEVHCEVAGIGAPVVIVNAGTCTSR